MRISENLNAYLMGEEFVSGLRVAFETDAEDMWYRMRTDILKELCAGKRVVHVGCVDHEPELIERKLKRNKWLHKHLCETAERCYGIDINEKGIEYVRDVLGYSDVGVVDILRDEGGGLSSEQWDYILLPDILEHIDNPVEFLSAIRARFNGNAKRVVITVPNVLTKGNFVYAKKGVEMINSDHRYWFTPYTVAKVAVCAGLRIEKMIMCRSGVIKRRAILRNWWYSRRPLMRNSIVLIAKLGG